jgi:hypothetical protein
MVHDLTQEDLAMMMFLTLLFIGFLAVAALSGIVYGTSPRNAEHPEVRPEAAVSLGPSQFFAGDLTARPEQPRLPLDAVIAQIERHVRLEQASAESYLEIPARERLHAQAPPNYLN